ncbi:DegV family protein [Proteocatella sphenisci]|uniref:DegV family protein n=1 Tax=Proteocatella sphenisci TaxID=181070 RepID=UPI00048EE98D|nr:DegV family protein [Proteocatella sphenisci]
MKQQTALLVDSGIDVPSSIINEYGIYSLPLKIIYKDREYSDGVDIQAEEVYKNLSVEIPKTSLPGAAEAMGILDAIKAQGYENVLVVTLSSGLSGTYNMVSLLTKDYEGLNIKVIDTKNIGIAGGMVAIQAAEYIREGMDFETLVKKVSEVVPESKIFFCVSTLEYLQKGGRIGLVSSMLGTALNLKPIISCNDEGIYYNVAKISGRKRSLDKMIDLAVEYASKGKRYNLAIVHGGAVEDAAKVKDKLLAKLSKYKNIFEGQISPALGVHTGPGLVGVGVQLLDN